MEIVKTDIILPEPGRSRGKLAFVLDNVLSAEECSKFIDEMESEEFEPALLNTQLVLDHRKCLRRLVFDEEKADWIFERIKKYLPEEWEAVGLGKCPIVGLNERLSVLKYSAGDYFKPHEDGVYIRFEKPERSFITIQLYLNEGFEGGNTTFIDAASYYERGWRTRLPLRQSKHVSVVPKTGRILVFEHKILHEGSLLKSGVKHSVRTDVMYRMNNKCEDVDQ